MIAEVTGKKLKTWLLLSFQVIGLSQTVFAQPFTHPGCLSTQADLDRMKAKVAANAHPWVDSWTILTANSHSSLSYNPNPTPTLIRGSTPADPENYSRAMNDAAAAYQTALRWWITGNTNYANKSIQILDAWSSTCTNLTGDSNQSLAAGLYGYEFASAAEIMRTYSGWASSNFVQFQQFMTNVFYPKNKDFLVRHHGTCDSHYWANWDLCNMDSMLAIGVLCDSRTIYNEAINYFKTGIGNGAASWFVYYMHPGYMGQWQEAGRDQGHCTLGPALLGPFCEIAWNQGDDMYGYNTNLFLAGAEYVAKYNVQPLLNIVPYVGYANCENDVQSVISTASRGTIRPGWDLVYNHYVNRKGLSAIFTAQIASQVRPEGGGGNYGSTSGGYDQLGFTTLTHTLDQIATNAIPVPSGLKPEVCNNAVTLSWWGNAYASSYKIKRATASGGPYTAIAFGLSTNLYYTDVGLLSGTNYYYVVSAVVGGAESSNSIPVSATADTRLTGTIIGSTGSYNSLGATITNVYDNALGNFYDAANGSGDWAGLDLGVSNVITQIKYSPRANFASRMVGGQFQGANVANFSNGVVTLFTVTTAPPDIAPGTLTTQTINNANAFRYVRYIGATNTSCNVGEVQFFGNASPATVPVAPPGLNATPGNAQVLLNWAVPAATTSFKLKRSLVSGGSYTTIATGITTTAYLDLGLTNFTTYYYVLSAVNATGESTNSAELAIAPIGLLLNRATGGTASDWTGSSQNGTEGPAKAFDGTTSTKWYNGNTPPGWLQYNFGAGITWAVARYDISSANDVQSRDPSAWQFQGSSNGSTWTTLDTQTNQTFASRFLTQSYWITNTTACQYYRLNVTSSYDMFTNASSTSTFGVQLSELALLAYSPAPPSAPTNLSATAGNVQVALSWNSSSGATSYNMKRSTTSGGPYTFTTIASLTTTTYTDTNVVNDTIYYYVVSPVNMNGEGGNSLEVSATPQVPAPTTPTGLITMAGDAQVALIWSASSGATGYNAKHSTTNGGPYAIVAGNVSVLTFTNTGLTNGTLYYFVVSATNAGGESVNSTQVSARPVSPVSTNLTFAVSSGQLQLTWPQDHTGWTLQAQTNSLDTGLGTNWVDVTNSIFTNQLIFPFSATNGGVFFRLKYP